jgi:hypothetical protein
MFSSRAAACYPIIGTVDRNIPACRADCLQADSDESNRPRRRAWRAW